MRRHRLTITLRNDLVHQLDKLIDGARLRNRSHAIEYLLGRSLLPSATKALILAGGAGVKLRPLTYELPKALIPIHGRPLIEHTIATLVGVDIRDLTCSIGHLGDKVKAHIGDGSRFGARVRYVEQKPGTVGTAQAVRQALGPLGDQGSLLIWYADVLARVPIVDLLAFHEQSGSGATVAVTSTREPSEWGVVTMSGSRVTDFTEKPKTGTKSHLIFAGIAVVNSNVLARIGSNMTSLEQELFPMLAREEKLSGYVFDGAWYDVSTPEVYERVLKEWVNGK